MSTVTSSIQPPPYIYKLNEDILYNIFFLNTCNELASWDPEKYYLDDLERRSSPLTATRQASQVCRAWRNVLLDAPSIWARCMDLDTIKENDVWRDLILQRSAQSLLVVTARQKRFWQRASSMTRFMEDLLDNHWARVAELYLTMDQFDVERTRLEKAFRRPAKNLRVFMLRAPDGDLRFDFQLFNGRAPLLERVCFPALMSPKSGINLESPLMFANNIRHVEFNRALDVHSVNELLAACRSMPVLETLELRVLRLVGDGPISEGPRVTIPRLKSLSVSSPILDIYPLFLDRITVPMGCEMHAFHYHLAHGQRRSAAQLQYMHDILSQYSNHTLSLQQDKKNFGNIVFRITPFSFAFCGYGKRLKIEVTGYSITDILAQLLDTVTSFDYPRIPRKLRLVFKTPDHVLQRENFRDWQNDHLIPKILRALRSLHEVHTLEILCEDLSYLHEVSAPEIMFPCLQKIILKKKNLAFNLEGKVLPFLLDRHATASIQVLYIKAEDENDISWQEVHSLDELYGLTIIWKAHNGLLSQYICGGSNELRGRGLSPVPM